MKHLALSTIIMTVGMFLGNNQVVAQTIDEDTPIVFKIGELDYQEGYEELLLSYSSSLLEVCNHEPMKAYENWLRLSLEMELFAQKIGFEIRGVKSWLHIFFNEDGTIGHLVYHLKPDSRFVQADELEQFFRQFIGQYNFPSAPGKKFANYSSMEFPVVYNH